ncbi:hypothetical protein TNCV_4017511 [Trichonephila clavipes]|nr:hypothetical protein TNCV_4017511 [Trichonephila clavipes]
MVYDGKATFRLDSLGTCRSAKNEVAEEEKKLKLMLTYHHLANHQRSISTHKSGGSGASKETTGNWSTPYCLFRRAPFCVQLHEGHIHIWRYLKEHMWPACFRYRNMRPVPSVVVWAIIRYTM